MLLILSFFTAHVYAETDKNILVLGDSLSAEYGLRSNSGWVELIKDRVKNHNHGYDIINISISGETTKGGLERLSAALDRYQPKILIIELGANDALQGLDLNTSHKNIQSMIDMARNINANTLLIGMLLPPNYGRQYTEQFSSMFSDLSKENNLELVPFLFEGFETKPDYFQTDNIHPNEKAQDIMADNVWAKLKNML